MEKIGKVFKKVPEKKKGKMEEKWPKRCSKQYGNRIP